jgi:copper amine oxidase-like protein
MPYVIGGNPVQLQDEPRNLNGPIYVPLREVVEAIGGKITWENQSKTAGATVRGRHARVPVDQMTFTLDGQPVTMSAATFMDANQVWVPVEFFEKAFGIVAIADANTNTVTVNT